MPITNDNKKDLNNMCPSAREAGLGDAVQTAQTEVATLQTDVLALEVQVAELEGNVGDPVQDIAALKAVVAADREDKQLRGVEDVEAIYIFDTASTAVGDDDLVVVPTDVTPPAAGRWLKTGGAGAAGDISYDNAGSGLVATDVQAAIDEVYAAVPAQIRISNPNPGYLGLVTFHGLATSINSSDEGSVVITAAEVIRAIHGVPVLPITYYMRKTAGAYGGGDTDPNLEMLTFDCDDVAAGSPTACAIKIIDSTPVTPQEWCEVQFYVAMPDGAGDCEICEAP